MKINTVELFDDIDASLRRYVAFPSSKHSWAITLWAAHTHVFKCFDSSPRLALLAPTERSGKTRILEVLTSLVHRPDHAINPTAAVLYRTIADDPPTFLLDEVDSYFSGKSAGGEASEALRGIINAGHRYGATVARCVGPRVKHFPIYTPLAMAGIGDLPTTVLDRSVVVRMKRRDVETEPVEPFTFASSAPEVAVLGERLTGWARGRRKVLAALPFVPPEGVTDRTADAWWALLAIAADAGGHWPGRALAALRTMVAEADRRELPLDRQILAHCRAVFAEATGGRLSSSELVSALNDNEEWPWAEMPAGKLTPRKLARWVRDFDVRPHNLTFGGGAQAKGYTVEDFADAWRRYLPPACPGCGELSSEGDHQGCETISRLKEASSAGAEEARPPAAEPSNVVPFVARQVTPSMAPEPCGSCATPTRWTDDAGAPRCSACRPTADAQEEDF